MEEWRAFLRLYIFQCLILFLFPINYVFIKANLSKNIDRGKFKKFIKIYSSSPFSEYNPNFSTCLSRFTSDQAADISYFNHYLHMRYARCILDHDIIISNKEKKHGLLLIVDSLCPLGNEITYLLRQNNIDHLDIRGKGHLDVNSQSGISILKEFTISKSLVVCDSPMSRIYAMNHPVISAVNDIQGYMNIDVPAIFGHIRGKRSLNETENLYYECLTKSIEQKEDEQFDQNKIGNTKFALAIDAAKYILDIVETKNEGNFTLNNLKTYSYQSLHQKFYSHCILNKKDELVESLLTSCKPFPPQDNKNLTLSILMTITLDKKYSSSANQTFYFFEYYLKNFPPFLPFEFVIIVIEKNDIDIDNILTIGENVRKYIRYIKISQKFYESFLSSMNFVNFPEFILKNIAVRRSKGEFILSISVDSFPNKMIFDFILNRQFNMNSYVRALRKNVKNDLSKISVEMNNEKYDFVQGFPKGNNLRSLRNSMFSTACGSFQLAHWRIWEIIHGFFEGKELYHVDTFLGFEMMAAIPSPMLIKVIGTSYHWMHSKKKLNASFIFDIQKYSLSSQKGVLSKNTFNQRENWGLGNNKLLPPIEF